MKRILTGLQCTSDQLHIGNYFGALKPLIDYQNEGKYEVFLFVANMHAFTNFHDGQALRHNILNLLKLYLASGIDPKKTTIYNQSDIAGHAQLMRVLGCLTNLGFMERMHAYKDAVNKGTINELSMGTFNYPILMAADIILYDADLVPVGKDQKQHVEFARDIAHKFNSTFGETFKLPDPIIKDEVAIIPGIDGRKMSKSYNNFLGMLDDEALILKKIKMIPTDAKAIEEPKDPDTCNVYNITKVFLTPEENTALRARYTQGGLSYKEAKDYLYEKTVAFLKPIQEKFHGINDSEVLSILHQHTAQMKALAEKKIKDVYEKIGFNI